MKKLIASSVFVLLVGCAEPVPVNRNFPQAPEELKAACPDLQETNPTPKLSEVVKVVTANYGQYHECKIKVDAWIEWYNSQKKIFEDVK